MLVINTRQFANVQHICFMTNGKKDKPHKSDENDEVTCLLQLCGFAKREQQKQQQQKALLEKKAH